MARTKASAAPPKQEEPTPPPSGGPSEAPVETRGGKTIRVRGKTTNRAKRAGLTFPVGRISRMLHKGNFAQRVSDTAPVYLSAVLEYLTAEILELAGNAAVDNKKKRIGPRHLLLAIKNDAELEKLLKDTWISEGGVLPHIEPVLIPKKAKKVKGAIHPEEMTDTQ